MTTSNYRYARAVDMFFAYRYLLSQIQITAWAVKRISIKVMQRTLTPLKQGQYLYPLFGFFFNRNHLSPPTAVAVIKGASNAPGGFVSVHTMTEQCESSTINNAQTSKVRLWIISSVGQRSRLISGKSQVRVLYDPFLSQIVPNEITNRMGCQVRRRLWQE